MSRYAICNELFEGWSWEELLPFLADLGYRGVELAPFTLQAKPLSFPAQRRAELRRQIADAGLQTVGLHWLLAKTQGLHLTAAEGSVRRATAAYLADLARLCRDLGGSLMVLGSPKQRDLKPGQTVADGMELAADTLFGVLPALDETGVTLCLEPLGPEETNFLNTLAEAEQLRQRLDHPLVRLHLDVKAMASEGKPIPKLIGDFASRAGHFHANDPNRRGPGFGACDFKPILASLRDQGYTGWISVEVFDYAPDPATIARESLRYLRASEPTAETTVDSKR